MPDLAFEKWPDYMTSGKNPGSFPRAAPEFVFDALKPAQEDDKYGRHDCRDSQRDREHEEKLQHGPPIADSVVVLNSVVLGGLEKRALFFARSKVC
jgi:hypothetical protein